MALMNQPLTPGAGEISGSSLIPWVAAGAGRTRLGWDGGGLPEFRSAESGALLLALLERLDVVVPQAFLVAGYCTEPNTSDEPVLQASYDWDAIRAHVRDIYFLNSEALTAS